jgi:hypothetical protein
MIPRSLFPLLSAVPPHLLVTGGTVAVLLVAILAAGGAYLLTARGGTGHHWPVPLAIARTVADLACMAAWSLRPALRRARRWRAKRRPLPGPQWWHALETCDCLWPHGEWGDVIADFRAGQGPDQ